MPIDKNQVKKVAKLSRISLDESKIDSLSKDLDSIISFVEKLNELDTKEIKTNAQLFSIISKKDVKFLSPYNSLPTTNCILLQHFHLAWIEIGAKLSNWRNKAI